MLPPLAIARPKACSTSSSSRSPSRVAAGAVADAYRDPQTRLQGGAAPPLHERNRRVQIGFRQDETEPGLAVGKRQLRKHRQFADQTGKTRGAVVGRGLRRQQYAQDQTEVGPERRGALQLAAQALAERFLRLQRHGVSGRLERGRVDFGILSQRAVGPRRVVFGSGARGQGDDQQQGDRTGEQERDDQEQRVTDNAEGAVAADQAIHHGQDGGRLGRKGAREFGVQTRDAQPVQLAVGQLDDLPGVVERVAHALRPAQQQRRQAGLAVQGGHLFPEQRRLYAAVGHVHVGELPVEQFEVAGRDAAASLARHVDAYRQQAHQEYQKPGGSDAEQSDQTGVLPVTHSFLPP